MKRARVLDDETQPAGSETADRSWFWSGEQNRWVDIISAWIMENDPFAGPEERGLAITVLADVCLPVSVGPTLDVCIGKNSKRVVARVTIPAPLWRELGIGLDKFIREVKKGIFLRCGLRQECLMDVDHCFTCQVVNNHLSWGSLVRCRVVKIPIPQAEKK